ncbi:beta strand repeat-containing protein, partial [Roseibium sp. RKSG952]|uniref:beta strand repeat-containing protein n=1 Tax=Roseibium sp. RKSG952 TaxID=2529384 RepID=UPI0034CF2246
GDGDNEAYGGLGDDTIYDGDGDNKIYGEDGDDVVYAEGSGSSYDGGDGTDTLDFSNASDAIILFAGDGEGEVEFYSDYSTSTFSDFEVFNGTDGDDLFIVTSGDATYDGGDGTDVINFYQEDDSITITVVDGVGTVSFSDGTEADLSNFESYIGTYNVDTFNIGAGDATYYGGWTDTINFTEATSGVTVNVEDASDGSVYSGTGTTTFSDGTTATFNKFYTIAGSDYDDTFTVGAGNSDTGDAGNVSYDGGDGTDSISFANATDGITLTVSNGGGTVSFSNGTYANLSNFESFIGTDDDDTFYVETGDASYDGGDGDDTISFVNEESGVAIDLDNGAGTVTFSDGSEASVSDFEDFIGTDDDDTFTVGEGDAAYDGGGGTNTISFANADDGVTVDFADGSGTATFSDSTTATFSDFDVLVGSAGDDTFTVGEGDATYDGGDGADTISFAAADSSIAVDVSDGAATVTFSDGSEASVSNFEDYMGTDDDDTFTVGEGDATYDGGEGSDTIGFDNADGGIALDIDDGAGTVTFSDGSQASVSDFENFTGTDADDTFTVGEGDAAYDGGDGTNTISFANADDGVTVDFAGRSGTATFSDGTTATFSDFDVLVGSAGDDTFTVGEGDATYDGGDGTDTISFGGADDGVTVNVASGSGTTSFSDGTTATFSDFEVLVGSAYDDTFYVQSGDGSYDGGEGTDTLNLSGEGSGITFNLDDGSGTVTFSDGSVASVSDFESYVGTDEDDSFTVGSGDATYDGGEGADTLDFSNADDGITIDVDDGAGTVTFSDGTSATFSDFEAFVGTDADDTFYADTGDTSYDGGDGTDTIDFSHELGGVAVSLEDDSGSVRFHDGTIASFSNMEVVDGTQYNDIFYAGSGGYTISGDDGGDALYITSDQDYTITYSDDDDTSGTITFEDGSEIVFDSIEYIYGGESDSLTFITDASGEAADTVGSSQIHSIDYDFF